LISKSLLSPAVLAANASERARGPPSLRSCTEESSLFSASSEEDEDEVAPPPTPRGEVSGEMRTSPARDGKQKPKEMLNAIFAAVF